MKELQKAESIDDNNIIKVIKGILNHGVDGIGPMDSSETLANEYLNDKSYKDNNERADAMIRWEASKNFGTGFVTGLGGLITLPVTVPASLYSSWVVQARLAGAIATLYGYSTSEDRVRTLILLSIIGDAGKQILKDAGVTTANKLLLSAVKSIPGKVLIEINKKVGFRLITKAGSKGVINLVKIVPVAGGLVGGVVDTVSCVVVGKSAKKIFRPADEPDEEKAGRNIDFNLLLNEEKLSELVSLNVDAIKSAAMPEDDIIELNIENVPINLKYRIVSFNDGTLKLQSDENFLIRGLVDFALDFKLKDLPKELIDVISFKDGVLSINVNRFLTSQQDVEGVEIDEIAIVDKSMQIKLK